METLEHIIKNHYDGKGEEVMWQSAKIISDTVEESMPAEALDHLKRSIYELMCGWHFNEYFAKEAVGKMYYTDASGQKKYAPYWTEQTVREIYEKVKAKIPSYNFWDFFVTLHMVASDTHELILKWFQGETNEQREARYIEMAVNWLNDEDNPYGKDKKIWGYINGK